MDNWDYIVFYGYDNLENVKPFRNSNNSMDTHAPSAITSKPFIFSVQPFKYPLQDNIFRKRTYI